MRCCRLASHDRPCTGIENEAEGGGMHRRSARFVNMLSSTGLAVAALSFYPPQPAQADTAPPADTPTSRPTATNGAATNAEDTGPVLSEIIVQARKRSESIMAAPVVIQAFTGEQLQNLRVTDTTQLASVTPGLDI